MLFFHLCSGFRLFWWLSMIVQRHFKEQSVLLLYSVFFVCSMFMLWELSIGRLFLLCYSIMFESYPPKGLLSRQLGRGESLVLKIFCVVCCLKKTNGDPRYLRQIYCKNYQEGSLEDFSQAVLAVNYQEPGAEKMFFDRVTTGLIFIGCRRLTRLRFWFRQTVDIRNGLDLPTPKMPVTTRITTCLIGNPCKPSFRCHCYCRRG